MFKKLLLVSLLSVLFILPLISCNTSPRPEFDIWYPPEWYTLSDEEIQSLQGKEKEDMEQEENLIHAEVLLHAGVKVSNDPLVVLPSLVVEIVPKGRFKTLREWFEWNEGKREEYIQGYKKFGVDILRGDTIVWTSLKPINGILSYGLDMAIWDGRSIWLVGVLIPMESLDTYSTTFGQIFESFRIKG